MKTLLLIFTLIISLNSYAQKPFVPVGAEWNYGIGYDTYPPYIQGHYGLKSIKDTIIETDTFSNINNEFYITSSDSFDYYFFRMGIPKKRLFQTNSQIGDTTTIDVYFKTYGTVPADTFIPLRIVIKDIHPMTNNVFNANDSTKVFEFTLADWDTIIIPPPFFLSSISGSYIHRVGQPGDFGNFLALFSPSPTMTPTKALRCFSSTEYNYKPTGLNKPCDYSNVGLNELNADIRLTLFPNPTHDEVNFYFEKGIISRITIYDINGKRVTDVKTSGKTHQEKIDVSTLKPGLYQCIIETNVGKTAKPLSIK